MKRAIVCSLSFALAALLSVAAAAQAPSLLRAGTRPLFGTIAFGPAIELDKTPTQFKLSQTFGYHFSGRADGEAIAVDLQQSFGHRYVDLRIVPRFVWDIQIIDNIGFYLTPSAGLGFVFWVPEQGDTVPGLTFQFAFDVKVILADRWVVFFRPVAIDVHPMHSNNDWTTGVRYELMVGGGITF